MAAPEAAKYTRDAYVLPDSRPVLADAQPLPQPHPFTALTGRARIAHHITTTTTGEIIRTVLAHTVNRQPNR
ncbi:hypothetical protein ACIRSJ_11780 [Streptomyces virginiae]|uniref:hypothetical protein n=1 Tax=Streptomyces virginiae TaxID=1961 RepID=UPI003811D82E